MPGGMRSLETEPLLWPGGFFCQPPAEGALSGPTTRNESPGFSLNRQFQYCVWSTSMAPAPTGKENGGGHAISQAANPGFGICADIACVCANLLPRRLRARSQSVRDHRSALDQMHSHCLRRGFSKAVRRIRWPYARAPNRGARPAATHSAYLRGPRSDSPAVPFDESDQSTGRRGDQSMRERVDRKCAVPGLLFRGRCRQGRRQKNWPELP
jgi:hypothetical protein